MLSSTNRGFVGDDGCGASVDSGSVTLPPTPLCAAPPRRGAAARSVSALSPTPEFEATPRPLTCRVYEIVKYRAAAPAAPTSANG